MLRVARDAAVADAAARLSATRRAPRPTMPRRARGRRRWAGGAADDGRRRRPPATTRDRDVLSDARVGDAEADVARAMADAGAIRSCST